MNEHLPPLPLLTDEGDSYTIYLSASPLCITGLVRFPHNSNVQGDPVRFWSLNEETRRAVLMQVRRRYPNQTIKIQ